MKLESENVHTVPCRPHPAVNARISEIKCTTERFILLNVHAVHTGLYSVGAPCALRTTQGTLDGCCRDVANMRIIQVAPSVLNCTFPCATRQNSKTWTWYHRRTRVAVQVYCDVPGPAERAPPSIFVIARLLLLGFIQCKNRSVGKLFHVGAGLP